VSIDYVEKTIFDVYLKEYLEETIIECIEENSEFSIIEWSQIFKDCENDFVNFPKVKEDVVDTDWSEEMNEEIGLNPEDSYEELDFENFEILSIDLDSETFIFCAGGDWQDPLEVSVTYDGNKFYFEVISKTFTNGISDEEFLEIVYGENWKEELSKLGYII